MNLTLIAAMSENRVIGKDNDLIWHMPTDMKRFMQLTTGHHVIMGRNTFESMGKKLLPRRTNIVVTRQKNYEAKGCIVVHELEAAISKAEGDSQPFIIGGAKLYESALPYAHTIELTVIHHQFEGDTFFPEFNKSEWILQNEESHPADDKNPYPFTFKTYTKQSDS